ncbi:hypothetical protein Tco_0624614 [Tanacetum coccineum]|uniref:Uncharacterized protein n=1 Tax=Tanacetum coccineum TaxID=301880 RepID=A0ABQ4WEI7_9ASTR
MKKEDLSKNRGTIAKSGTSAFVEKMQHVVTLLVSLMLGLTWYVWESKADGAFAISEIHSMSHLVVELELDCTSERKTGNT